MSEEFCVIHGYDHMVKAPLDLVARCALCEEKRARAKELFETCVDVARAGLPKPDPRDPDHTRSGIFVYHNCALCKDGREHCVQGSPSLCSYPYARND